MIDSMYLQNIEEMMFMLLMIDSMYIQNFEEMMFMLTGSYSSGEGALSKGDFGKVAEGGGWGHKWPECLSFPLPHLDQKG